MKKLVIVLAAIFTLVGCSKVNKERDIQGTWYCKIGEDIIDVDDKKLSHAVYLTLEINRNSNTAQIKTSMTEYNDYWSEGSGTYTINGNIINFDFIIDVPPPYEWWQAASRKIIKGTLMPKAINPTLKVEIESTIGEEVTREVLWFKRDLPI